MYDQDGFYSDNFQPGAGRPAAGRRSAAAPNINFDFGGFDFGGRPGRTGCSWRRGRRRKLPRFVQPVFPRRRSAAAEMEVEQEPGGDLEYQIEIDFWDAVRGAVKKTADHAHGNVRNLPRHGRDRIAANMPDVRWQRDDSASRRENAIQRAVHALRRHRQTADRRARRAAAKAVYAQRRRSTCASPRASLAVRACVCPAKATPARWALRRAICICASM